MGIKCIHKMRKLIFAMLIFDIADRFGVRYRNNHVECEFESLSVIE